MNIYVYSDESGVFDKEHNNYFVFGGLILWGTEDKENWSRKYSSFEKMLRTNKGVKKNYELKATQVTNKEKGKLYRSLNGRYELQEFKLGTYNYKYDTYYEPILEK